MRREEPALIIGFTGTQRGMTKHQKDGVEGFLFQYDYADEFHHGGCIGADAEAHDIAEKLGIECVIHPPINSVRQAFKTAKRILKPRPYLDRNKDIVNACTTLLATPDGEIERTRSGTWSTIRYAGLIKRNTCIVFPNGSVKWQW